MIDWSLLYGYHLITIFLIEWYKICNNNLQTSPTELLNTSQYCYLTLPSLINLSAKPSRRYCSTILKVWLSKSSYHFLCKIIFARRGLGDSIIRCISCDTLCLSRHHRIIRKGGQEEMSAKPPPRFGVFDAKTGDSVEWLQGDNAGQRCEAVILDKFRSRNVE